MNIKIDTVGNISVNRCVVGCVKTVERTDYAVKHWVGEVTVSQSGTWRISELTLKDVIARVEEAFYLTDEQLDHITCV